MFLFGFGVFFDETSVGHFDRNLTKKIKYLEMCFNNTSRVQGINVLFFSPIWFQLIYDLF